MPRHLAVVVAVALILVCGVVHGWWSDRWQRSAALEEALARVARVPMTLGAWQAENVPADAKAFEQAGAQAYWMRAYTNTQNRHSVLAILMCGRAGRMAVHTPEVCYRGAGYDLFDAPASTVIRVEQGGELGAFNTARFTKAATLGNDLKLYWGWNPGAGWQAPANPRWEFRGRPFLYKLYVSTEYSAGHDAAADFLRELLPELQHDLLSEDK
jgi:uncharacterized protein DUF3485